MADEIRPFAPEIAARIDQAVQELREGKRERLTVNVSVRATLEKFDGEYEPGKAPVETVVMEG